MQDSDSSTFVHIVRIVSQFINLLYYKTTNDLKARAAKLGLFFYLKVLAHFRVYKLGGFLLVQLLDFALRQPGLLLEVSTL
jgi:hypothetical protein